MQVTLGAILTFISALKTSGDTYFPEPHGFFVVRISGNFRDSCPQKPCSGRFEIRVRCRGPESVSEKQVARAVDPGQLPRLAEPAEDRAVNRRLRSVADSIHRAAMVSAGVGQRQSNGVNSRKKVSKAVAAEVTGLKPKGPKARKKTAQGKANGSRAPGGSPPGPSDALGSVSQEFPSSPFKNCSGAL